jgi:hypothetical protein
MWVRPSHVPAGSTFKEAPAAIAPKKQRQEREDFFQGTGFSLELVDEMKQFLSDRHRGRPATRPRMPDWDEDWPSASLSNEIWLEELLNMELGLPHECSRIGDCCESSKTCINRNK